LRVCKLGLREHEADCIAIKCRSKREFAIPAVVWRPLVEEMPDCFLWGSQRANAQIVCKWRRGRIYNDSK
jgi:hypothetical protein